MYWRNSNFQYVHFILGACHTATEAHRKCSEAVEDRQVSLCEAARKLKRSWLDRLLCRKQMGPALQRQTQASIDQAQRELDFLLDCKGRLEAALGYVPTPDDYQQNQREEWRLELEHRAENCLASIGYIPSEQFSTMRLHPDFASIQAKIKTTTALLKNGGTMPVSTCEWTHLLESK